MNLEICKSCLSNVNLHVTLQCSIRRDITETKVFLRNAFLSSEDESGFDGRCVFQIPSHCKKLIDSKFLGERFGWHSNVEVFQLKAEEYENFFNLLDSSCVHRFVGNTPDSSANCSRSFEHNLYDWNLNQ